MVTRATSQMKGTAAKMEMTKQKRTGKILELVASKVFCLYPYFAVK